MTSIIFMGTPDFSAPILRMLHHEGYDIKAVVTQPDRPVGRKRVLTPPPVKAAAIELGLPVIQPEKLRGSEELQQILDLQPDLVIQPHLDKYCRKHYLMHPRLDVLTFMHHFYPNIVEVHRFTKRLLMVKKRQV